MNHNSDEEINDINTEELNISEFTRNTNVILTSHQDVVSIQMNASIYFQNLKTVESDAENYSNKSSFENIIIDINKLTKRLNPSQIKELWIKELVPNFNGDLISQDSDDSQANDDSESEQIQIEEMKYSCGLEERQKNQKLTTDQMQFLLQVMNNRDLTIKEISAKYKVSYSVLSKIYRLHKLKVRILAAKNFLKLNIAEKKKLLGIINKYWRITNHTFTARNVADYVNQELNHNYSLQFIRRFMKEEAKLTFKKEKPRPNNVDFDKIKQSRKLYAIKLSRSLTFDTLVINIDASSINRHIQKAYSWSLKGTQKEAKNSPFNGSTSLVLSICYNGSWI